MTARSTPLPVAWDEDGPLYPDDIRPGPRAIAEVRELRAALAEARAALRDVLTTLRSGGGGDAEDAGAHWAECEAVMDHAWAVLGEATP